MSSKIKEFWFKNYRFDRRQERLFENGDEIDIPALQKKALRLLLDNAGDLVKRDSLKTELWPGVVTESDRNLNFTISKLREILGDRSEPRRFIKTIPKEGYCFIADVGCFEIDEIVVDGYATDSASAEDRAEIRSAANEEIEDPVRMGSTLGANGGFKLIISLWYGVLFLIALALEVSYRFDEYSSTIAKIAIPIICMSAAAMFLSLNLIEALATSRLRIALLSAVMVILVGGAMVYAGSLQFLPADAVTLSDKVRTQPAYAAFFKSIFVYFVPAAIFVVVIPFHFVHARISSRRRNSISSFTIYISPSVLSGVAFVVVFYSLITSFLFIDGLSESKFRGLFIIFSFLRFVAMFGLIVFSILWYRRALELSRISLPGPVLPPLTIAVIVAAAASTLYFLICYAV